MTILIINNYYQIIKLRERFISNFLSSFIFLSLL